jgi:hypothetical protein
MKLRPVVVWRELRAAVIAPITAPRVPWLVSVLGTAAMVVAGLVELLVMSESGIGVVHYAGRDHISRIAMLVAFTPIVVLATIVRARYLRWLNRGTEPFAFPVRIELPDWRVFRSDGDDALYLTDGASLVALFVREGRQSLEAVLDVIDPDNELEMDDEKPMSVSVDLPEPTPAVGVLQRTTEPDGYILILTGRRDRADVLASLLGRSKARYPGDPMQLFRPLQPAAVIS